MYPTEAFVFGLTAQEQEIIHSIRILIGDQKSTEIEEVLNGMSCDKIKMGGSVYKLDDKGWPIKIIISGTEYSNPIDPQVENYQFLVFSGTGVLDNDISIMYNTFRFSDIEILDAYDFSASSVLTAQCNLTPEQLTPALLNLATSVVLLQGEYQKYAEQAVEMKDNDSEIDTVERLNYLQRELQVLRGELERAIKKKLACASYSLPVIRVE